MRHRGVLSALIINAFMAAVAAFLALCMTAVVAQSSWQAARVQELPGPWTMHGCRDVSPRVSECPAVATDRSIVVRPHDQPDSRLNDGVVVRLGSVDGGVILIGGAGEFPGVHWSLIVAAVLLDALAVWLVWLLATEWRRARRAPVIS